MITECEFAISDAEAFSNALSNDLSVLDGRNIQSIMGSEAQVSLSFLFAERFLKIFLRMMPQFHSMKPIGKVTYV